MRESQRLSLSVLPWCQEIREMLQMSKAEIDEKNELIKSGCAGWTVGMAKWWFNPLTELREAVRDDMCEEALIGAGYRSLAYRRVSWNDNDHEGSHTGMKFIIRGLQGILIKGSMSPDKFAVGAWTWYHSLFNRVAQTLRVDYPNQEWGGPSDPKWRIPPGEELQGHPYPEELLLAYEPIKTWTQERDDAIQGMLKNGQSRQSMLHHS